MSNIEGEYKQRCITQIQDNFCIDVGKHWITAPCMQTLSRTALGLYIR